MQVNRPDTWAPFSRRVDQAVAGLEVLIDRAGKSLVRLVPVEQQPSWRRGGFLRGQDVIRTDPQTDCAVEIERNAWPQATSTPQGSPSRSWRR